MMEKSWQLLGIEETTDKDVIRQAYRAKLPVYHPETDPDGFKALREAYEYAMHYADFPESTIDISLSELQPEENTSSELSEQELQANEICQNYQALLDDPERRYNINQWHQFVASFYDYPMEVIDIAKWQLLEISYNASYLSLTCAKVLADSLRWRQQLTTQSPDKVEQYDNFLNQVNNGDYFDYALLPTINKTIQNVTLDYFDFARWIFWERPPEVGEMNYYLSQDTVVYLTDEKQQKLQISKWLSFSLTPNQAILDYALSRLNQTDLEENLIIEWKYIVANQYSLLNDKDNSLKYWLEIYNSGHYQEKSVSWLIHWCAINAKNYLPLLIFALNQSHCLAIDIAEDPLYTVPRLSPTTISLLIKLKKEDFSTEIAEFITWALMENWDYRQILSSILNDDGSNRLARLYRHAIMLRHGNEILLQEILDEQSEDAFEQFILQNLQRQAKQNLIWLSELKPVKEFKEWLFDNNETVPIPEKFNPQSQNNQLIVVRLLLDRFDYLPYTAKLRLYNNFNYSHMEMNDWSVFFTIKEFCDFPMPPNASIRANNKNAYWQWYRYCILVIALANEPVETIKYLQKEHNIFYIPDDSPIFSIVQTIKNNHCQDITQLYNAIESNNKLINCILINYPESIESVIDKPNNFDFADITQKIEQLWQPKLANSNPIYLMLLNQILLSKYEQKPKLHEAQQKIAGNSQELNKIAKILEKEWRFPLTFDKEKYQYTEQVEIIKNFAERLSRYYGLCNEEELQTLIEFKDDADNDLILRLCCALLLKQNTQNQEKINSLAIAKNSPWQFWRVNGRTDIKGFLLQISFSLISWIIIELFGLEKMLDTITFSIISYDTTAFSIIFYIIIINAFFAVKRRFNDIYRGQPYFAILFIIFLPIFLIPCWFSSFEKINRNGPPIERKKPVS